MFIVYSKLCPNFFATVYLMIIFFPGICNVILKDLTCVNWIANLIQFLWILLLKNIKDGDLEYPTTGDHGHGKRSGAIINSLPFPSLPFNFLPFHSISFFFHGIPSHLFPPHPVISCPFLFHPFLFHPFLVALLPLHNHEKGTNCISFFLKIMKLEIEEIAAQRSFIFLWCGSHEGLDEGRKVQ